MRIVFMGTPQIAADALSALLSAGHEVVAVYTREDKPQGRKQLLVPSPVKQLAQEHGLPVFQPKTLRDSQAEQQLAELEPQLVVVVAYGLIFPKNILQLPPHGCINLHVSLLPKYRGAAPIQWAVINGDAQTGVSIMQMDEGVDTGPVLAMQSVDIGENTTSGELFETVSEIGAKLLVQTVADVAAGSVKPQPQKGEASSAPQLNKQMAELNFDRGAAELHNLIRGCNPWPVAWFMHGEQRVQVLQSSTVPAQGGAPGEIIATSPLTISCQNGDKALVLSHVRPQGSREMRGEEWAAGRRFKAGMQIV